MGEEPRITINGQQLTEGQAMTVRVAIESFASLLSSEGLGDDQLGKDIARNYLERISEIRNIIFGVVA